MSKGSARARVFDGTARGEPHYDGCSEANMSAKSAKEFEEFARDCVRLAEQADTPMLREKLLNLAREWMHAVMPDLVWRFRSPHHFCGKSEMRTSEPKPH
jgi:hypothetical protein